MGRAPCCEKMGLKRGPWTPEEDKVLIHFIQNYGHGNWRALPKQAGLLRCGKSCRLRWTNYLRPDIKRGNFSNEEEEAIIKLHEMLGNRWSAIAARLPGRTDNEIKNVWHTHLKKRLNKNDTTPTKAKASKTSKSQETGVSDDNSSSPVSPQSSSDVSSNADSSSVVTSENHGMGSNDEYNETSGTKGEYSEPSADFFEIDEDFWTAEDLDIIADFPSPTGTEIQSPTSISSSVLNVDEGMDFWFDLYLQPVLPEF
ncbi:hypothetical protein ACHQM5_014062 [Ranunculus cassubicifolius]